MKNINKSALRILILLFGFAISSSSFSSSQLDIIADHGGVAAEDVIRDLLGMDESDIERSMKVEKEKVEQGEYKVSSYMEKLKPQYPMQSIIGEGAFSDREFDKERVEVVPPIVLLSDGVSSKRWLSRNKNVLSGMGAFVVVVDAKSEESAWELSKIYGDDVIPMNLNEFITAYDIPALPALVNSKGIYQ
jgi:hypothetical protein